jgi:hypothetical protein
MKLELDNLEREAETSSDETLHESRKIFPNFIKP